MKLTEFFREELDREVERSRKALEQVPEDKYNWKPHDKSMIFGYLADMVATIPTWITMEIDQDELDIAPAEGKGTKQGAKETKDAIAESARRNRSRRSRRARKDDRRAFDDELETARRRQRRLGGNAQEMIQDTISHWSHHRGQMTVYLRLMGAKVPAIYRPIRGRCEFLNCAARSGRSRIAVRFL